MIKISVDTSDLLKWRDFLGQAAKRTEAAAVRALNSTGDALIEKLAGEVADEMGLSQHEVKELINVRKANAANKEYRVDLSALYDQEGELQASRELPGGRPDLRSTPDDTPFAPGSLVKIVTAGDELVCSRCEDMAEDGPYTIEEARALLPHHPHCRCTVIPFYTTRRIPVTMSGSNMRNVKTATSMMTLNQLAQRMKDEMQFALKMK